MLYGIVGGIAVAVALSGGDSEGKAGAVRQLASSGMAGTAALVVLAVGLTLYAVWRAIQLFSPPPDLDGVKGRIKQASFGFRAVAYGALSVLTWRTAVQGAQSGGGDKASSWTASLLQLPAGPVLVAIVAGIVAIVAINMVRKAVDASFMDAIQLPADMDSRRTWIERSGRAGYAARAVVYGIIAWFVAQAAFSQDAGEARGLDGALSALAAAPYGAPLLLIVALGLTFYGGWCLAVCRWHTGGD